MKKILFILFLFVIFTANSQNYTSYFTGNSTNITTNPQGGVCMMGGASEHDEAMRWFLQRANGGDVLVLRASGSNGYNNYMYSQLGVSVNSVETIVFHNANASSENYIIQKIEQAEAIWFAGGDQSNYVDYWRDSEIKTLINNAVNDRNVVIGGTSAGMAILGEYYYTGENGTVTSSQALTNPYHNRVTVDETPFLNINYLNDVITDTHYDDRSRKGRHVVFLARAFTDFNVIPKGIACNEYTAVCIDENGLASVYGDYPNYPESAYFIQTNCELAVNNPETCIANTPLDWNLNGTALRVYKVNGTNNGANTFDLSDWKTGNGGSWHNWYVNNGSLVVANGIEINCETATINDVSFENNLSIYPNPFQNEFQINSKETILEIKLFSKEGKLIMQQKYSSDINTLINTEFLNNGIYFLNINTTSGVYNRKIIKYL